jgi:hypothetical protein
MFHVSLNKKKDIAFRGWLRNNQRFRFYIQPILYTHTLGLSQLSSGNGGTSTDLSARVHFVHRCLGRRAAAAAGCSATVYRLANIRATAYSKANVNHITIDQVERCLNALPHIATLSHRHDCHQNVNFANYSTSATVEHHFPSRRFNVIAAACNTFVEPSTT